MCATFSILHKRRLPGTLFRNLLATAVSRMLASTGSKRAKPLKGEAKSPLEPVAAEIKDDVTVTADPVMRTPLVAMRQFLDFWGRKWLCSFG